VVVQVPPVRKSESLVNLRVYFDLCSSITSVRLRGPAAFPDRSVQGWGGFAEAGQIMASPDDDRRMIIFIVIVATLFVLASTAFGAWMVSAGLP